jgi:hypothetical protein
MVAMLVSMLEVRSLKLEIISKGKVFEHHRSTAEFRYELRK